MIIESGLRADRNTRPPMQIAVRGHGGEDAPQLRADLRRLRLPAPRARRRRPRDGDLPGDRPRPLRWRWSRAPARARRSRCAGATSRRARPLLREVVRIALPSVGERLVMNLALLSYFRILADYGTVAIAAYTVGDPLLSFSWIPGIGFGTAARPSSGQALGAGDLRGARERRLARRPARRSPSPSASGSVCAWPARRSRALFTDDAGDDRRARALPAVPGPRPALPAGALHAGRRPPRRRRHLDAVRRRRRSATGAARAARHRSSPSCSSCDVVWIWNALMLDHMARTTWLAALLRGAALDAKRSD